MDFLKSAVASAIAKGPPFPYSFGDKVDIDESIWTLRNGTKREDGSKCSIFSFDITANRSRLPLARNALKKLRTLRHPGVIKVLDTVETETYIYIATERLDPLRWHVKRKSLTEEAMKWGLHSIANTVKFINKDASSIHGNLKVGSVYTSESGEWKLGGFEVLSGVTDDEAIIYTYGSMVPDSGRYAPPELARNGWDTIKKGPHTAVDSFNMGTLIFEVFNGFYSGGDQAGQTTSIPPSMHSSYKRLVNANPKARISVANFLEMGRRNGAFFDVPIIKITDDIENLGVKSPERERLFSNFPEDFLKMKVLPELLKSVEFGGWAEGPRGHPYHYTTFGNPDRAIRVCLLDGLPLIIDKLTQKVVNDKIFPQLVTGFTDVAPLVREQTLKSVLVIVPKLSDRTVNGELLRYLAKTANDEQPGIRTNTTICLGKMAKNLSGSTRSKVLIAAFSRSLRDPFVHARSAALMALAATTDCFSDEDCASRVLPSMCPLLVDKEKPVRDQANKTIEVYLQKIRKAAEAMADSALPPVQAADGSAPRMGTPQPSESAAAGWAGWAISSFTNKLSTAAGEIQANGATSPKPIPPGPPPVKSAHQSSASTLHRQAVKSPPPAKPSDKSPPASSLAYDDGSEPDFAGWLAAQSQKKSGGKPLPKGLAKAKPTTTTSASRPAPSASRTPSTAKATTSKPAAGKKISLAPKQSNMDDDGWGEGW
ncbi:unnamed protein product [Parascedosporium putredinis]|uniref:Protein kinase domain-containing protein n=1 Tax=Parascedosporium putredinis TaxID=1442378 RepID=A0A9P1H4T4_9PEZI|nr:unnamed protein product [Parascedosporium putredinis]CAI7995955.1 unnamed protein product [Parascedosporium putredinis]